jgi:RimJ/RimL family protein N-acetyltransferase
MPYADDLPMPTRLVVMVTHPDGRAEPVGTMSWIPVYYGPTVGCRAWSIGIGLVEAWRGRGIGTVAQRDLADHLLRTTEVERIEASTDVENIAEQRSLEKAGYIREGVTRSAQWRADGRHHDLVVYSRIRKDSGEQRSHA